MSLCIPALSGFGNDCQNTGFRDSEIDKIILATRGFDWGKDVIIPESDPSTTVAVGAYTDVAAWQTAIDNNILAAIDAKVTEGDVTTDTSYKCKIDRVVRSTQNFTVEVDCLPLDSYDDYTFFNKINQSTAGCKAGLKMLGFVLCDGSIRFLDFANLGGLNVGGYFRNQLANEDTPNEMWTAELTVRTGGVFTPTREDLPDIAALFE